MLYGNIIRELRDEQGVLQRQLAAALEIDTPMFSKIERGDRMAKREQVNVGDNVGDMSEIKITERQKEIINMIKESPSISARQMSETLSVTSRTVERDLASLKAMGILMRKGTDNDGEWIILQ